MAGIVEGVNKVNLSSDEEGHRTYNLTQLVRTSDTTDGPYTAAHATGVPLIGDTWAYYGEVDPWAFCTPERKVKRAFLENEPDVFWEVQSIYTTIPIERCQDTDIENPLNEPDRIGGNFSQSTQEGKKDRNGKPIVSSSGEYFSGQANQWDEARPTVRIGMNLATLPLSTFAPMVNSVNDAVLWGLPKRSIKLANVNWTRNVYGTCNYFYTVDYEFEINYNTFDRTLIDQGTRVLKGEWIDDCKTWKTKDPTTIPPDLPPGYNPDGKPYYKLLTNYVQYTDCNGQFGGDSSTFLDGFGRPIGRDIETKLVELGPFEFYEESNFLTLGIPTSL